LHTNGSENDIRCQVTKRKVSGGTRSDMGRRFSAQSQARQPSEYSRCFVLIRRGAQGA
jgi:hypothetical protein